MGSLAPFTGILISEQRYRIYAEHDQAFYEVKDKKCPPIIVDQRQDDEWAFHPVSAFGGFSVGVSLMALVFAFKH